MERTCGKCKGQGGFAKRRTTTFSQFVSGDTGWVKCAVCGGSGVNPNYREKRCEKCSGIIGYHKDSNFPPKYCDSCKARVAREKAQKQQERERQNAMWREKSCPGLRGGSYCGNTIRYRLDWAKVSDICPSCIEKAKAQRTQRDAEKAQRDAEWREKPCSRGCGNMIRYNINWDRPPSICKSCKEKGADIYRSELIPPGWHSSLGTTQIDKAHGTMVFLGKGTNGAGYRVSWNGYGEAHWTDEGITDKNDPRRHRDPRK